MRVAPSLEHVRISTHVFASQGANSELDSNRWNIPHIAARICTDSVVILCEEHWLRVL